MLIEGRTGSVTSADGGTNVVRLTRECAQVIQQAHARYTESATRGQVFTASTGVAGVAPGTNLNTTPPFCLYNPANSGKYLVVVETYIGYVSGTLGGGMIAYAAPGGAQVSTPTGGTVLSPINALLGGAPGATAQVRQSATLASTPVILKPAYTLGAALASTPAFAALVKDVVDGSIVVAPGSFVAMQGVAAAGTSPLVAFGMTWEEIPM